MTRSFYEDDLKEWIKWHLDILKFDHLRIFDNESTIDIKSIVGNDKRITVESITGWPNQVALYQKAYNECKYDWIYFGDSDEFLWFNFNEYKDVNNFVEEKFIKGKQPNIAVWWRLVGNNKPLKEHTMTPTKWNVFLQEEPPESMCKCFYKIKGNFKWNRIYVHLPEPPFYTTDSNGYIVNSSVFPNPAIVNRFDAMIFHYYHRTYDEWKFKQQQQNPTTENVNYTSMVKQCNTYDDYVELCKSNKYTVQDLRIVAKLYPELIKKES